MLAVTCRQQLRSCYLALRSKSLFESPHACQGCLAKHTRMFFLQADQDTG